MMSLFRECCSLALRTCSAMHRNSIGTNTERHWHTLKNRKRSSAWCPRCQLLSVFGYTSNICETIHAAVVAKEGKCICENIDGLVYEDKCPVGAAYIHRTQQFVLVLANYKRARNAQNVTKGSFFADSNDILVTEMGGTDAKNDGWPLRWRQWIMMWGTAWAGEWVANISTFILTKSVPFQLHIQIEM